MQEIAVVIPVRNGGDKLVRCLSSLARTEPPPAEVIVVKDGGEEDLGYVETDFGARLIELSQHGGPARARNEGVRRSTAEIILFIDADVTVNPDVIERVAEIFTDSDVSAVFGSYDDQPAETNFLSQYRNLLHHYVHQTGRVEGSTFWGACGAIRRRDFEAAGGFDDKRYPLPSIEDVELGNRLKKAGKRILLSKTLQVRHLKRWDLVGMIKTDFFQRALPWTELILRDKNFVNDLNTNTKNRFSVLFSLVLVAALTLCFWSPILRYVAILSAMALLIVNAPFYWFLWDRRGLTFALRAIPMHWLLLLLSGLAFAVGTTLFQLDRLTNLSG